MYISTVEIWSKQDVVINVPAGFIPSIFAYGADWYRTHYFFVDAILYEKDDENCDFNSYTDEYTLYPISSENYTSNQRRKILLMA